MKKITLLIGIIAFTITELGRSFYRPYIYENNINDSFVADTIGNSFGTMTAIFIILTLAGKGTAKDWGIIIIVVVGLLFYELLNITGKNGIDFQDLLATIIFGQISSILYFFLLKKYGGNQLTKVR